ncbi:MAG: hypothetical protein OEV64_04110 [Desulfobulbaceae bacterium]|nr:hypothetical protein [Desulfobulbaceae bacterium]
MTNNKETGKLLMVVVTRGYAQVGSNNDEFVHEWGYEESEPYKWENDNPEVALLVVHGDRKFDPKKTIEEAFQDKEAPPITPEKVYFFHHSLNDQLDNTRKAINTRISVQISVDRIYNSEGGTAVDGLVRILREGIKENGYPECLKDAVESAATGRRMFVSKLYDLSSGLLRLRLLFDAVASSEFYGEAGLVHRLTEQVLGSSSKWNKWIQALENGRQGILVKEAIKNLTMLSFPKNNWEAYASESDWVSDHQKDAIAIRHDFLRLARSIDVLLSAMEDPPLKPKENRTP